VKKEKKKENHGENGGEQKKLTKKGKVQRKSREKRKRRGKWEKGGLRFPAPKGQRGGEKLRKKKIVNSEPRKRGRARPCTLK